MNQKLKTVDIDPHMRFYLTEYMKKYEKLYMELGYQLDKQAKQTNLQNFDVMGTILSTTFVTIINNALIKTVKNKDDFDRVFEYIPELAHNIKNECLNQLKFHYNENGNDVRKF